MLTTILLLSVVVLMVGLFRVFGSGLPYFPTRREVISGLVLMALGAVAFAVCLDASRDEVQFNGRAITIYNDSMVVDVPFNHVEKTEADEEVKLLFSTQLNHLKPGKSRYIRDKNDDKVVSVHVEYTKNS